MPFRLTDTEWVMIVVAAIYLFECAFWARREAICLSTLLGRFRALPSPSFMGNEQYKLVVGNPSPLARCFVCELWPIAVSPEGIGLPQGIRVPPGEEATCHVAFDAIGDAVVAVEKEVYRQGRRDRPMCLPGAGPAAGGDAQGSGRRERGRSRQDHRRASRPLDRQRGCRGTICRIEEVDRSAAGFGIHLVRIGVPRRPGHVLFALAADLARRGHLLRDALFELDAHGLGLRRVPQAALGREVFPAVSPRGHALVVARFRHAIAGGVAAKRPGGISSVGRGRGALHEIAMCRAGPAHAARPGASHAG